MKRKKKLIVILALFLLIGQGIFSPSFLYAEDSDDQNTTEVYETEDIVTIEDEETPLALNQTWALFNLLLLIMTVFIAIGMIATMSENDPKHKRKLIGIIPSLASFITFLMTEDMSANMVWTDNFSYIMFLFFLANILLAYMTRNSHHDDNGEGQEFSQVSL